jgi:hypothetical protein
MQFTRQRRLRCFVIASALLLTLLAIASPRKALAQEARGDAWRGVVHELIGVGGYWFTDSSAVRALGTPKFGGSTNFYVRPAHRGNLLITGGIELVGASDHWLPFSGGNSFDLTGASFRVSGERRTAPLYRLVPFVTGGLFVGHIHSELQNFSTTQFVPSMAVGMEMKIHRYLSISAQYRVSGHIGGVNIDGFNLSLKLF